MDKFVRWVIWSALFGLCVAPAWAVCPSTVTDCTGTPIYQTVQGWNGVLGGPWTTAARPLIPVPGLTGFNSTIGTYETWNGTLWTQAIVSGAPLTVTAPWTFNVGPILLPGSAPGTPVNGQMWLTSAGLFYESNGLPVGPLEPSGGVTWPTVGAVVISNGTSSPPGLFPVNGDCLLGLGGAWSVQPCPGGISGPGPTVNGYVPQWNSTSGAALGAGLPVGFTGTNTIVETTSNGQVNASVLPFGTGANQVAEGGVIGAGSVGSATLIPVLTYNAAGQITAVSTAAPSPITINGQSCAVGGSCTTSTPSLSAAGVTGNQLLGTLPANSWPLRLLLRDLNGVGGATISLGTTLGASDILSPRTVPATGIFSLTVDITSFSVGSFLHNAAQPVYITSSGGGNSITAQLDYEPGP